MVQGKQYVTLHQDSSLHHFLSHSLTVYSARAETLVILDTFNRSCYLLSYLLRCMYRRNSAANGRSDGGVYGYIPQNQFK